MFRSSDRRSYSHKSRIAAFLASTALVGNSVFANAVFAQALPTGGQVAAGSASIGAPSNGAMTINQNSNSAVINWQSFNIGQNNSVTFVQPDASSAILNRVTGSTSTTIAGQLNANGQVYLVNPNGIAITSTGTINTGAFVASTLGISDEDFMSGKRTFTGNGASAPVSNAGTITINRGGYMALIGGTVANLGVINVPMGKAALGSGEQATLDISGDGFLQVAIPTRAAGANPLVSNSGRISARGGTVQLSAAAARDMARQAINMSGTIEAKGVAGKSGDITLFGGDGEVAVSGTLNARNNRGTGGKITVTGRQVALTGAKVDASGRTGGGTINIGGERQGKGALRRAETLSVDAKTVIKADALKSGNGGNIVLWSDNLTNFAGTITARGGADAGNGGEVEVSGKEKLVYTGFTDLSASKGSLGNLLLDPYNVIISNGTDTSGFTASGNDSVINVNTLITALSAANVTVSTGSSGTQAGTITVADPLAWASGSTLTLNAASDININAAINAPSGGLSLYSGGTISATAGVNVATFALNAGNWVQNNATLPSFYAKDFQINGGSFLRVTGGDGTSGTPYQLADIYGLQGVGSSPAYLQASWTLANDIDASGTVIWNAGAGFNPIGNGSVFSGNLDGGGHVISGLTINRPTTDNVGLIGSLSGTANPSVTGIVRNIGLSGGSITGGSRVGGLVGYAEQASISNALSSARVTGAGSSIGGLVGQNYATALSNSYATGAVTGSSSVGGLVGLNEGTISGSYATGAVSGMGGIGGLVGGMQTRGPMAEINTSYATGAVAVATNGSGGGLAGYVNNGIIGQSYASGAVNGLAGAHVGGLVGFAQNATINQSYATGSTSTSGAGYAGGLIGMAINATINQTYATGAVSAASGYAGGFVGSRSGGSYANSYFDTQTTGQAVAVAMGPSDTVSGLTTAQARDKSNYTGWDFNSVWYQSGDMRPILRAEAASAAADGYIPISNLNQLALMGANPTANYKLATDLNATATSGSSAAGIWSTSGWVPVETFFGTLDGQNHTISNLYINRPSTDGVGLFANVSGWNTPYPGAIRNIGLVGGSITGRANVGALIGVSDTAAISNVWSSANVTGNGKSIGGLVGWNYWTTISDSRTSGTVTGNSGASDIGGLVGRNEGVINRSYATGAVNAISMATDGGIGGLVGFMQSSGSAAQVNASYATGNVTASGGAAGTQAGGLIGRMISATVNQSYATGNVSSTATGSLSNSGGLVGRAQSSTINQSYATGSAYSANGFAAGLVGYLITNGMVNESYATGYVSGGNGSAGLVGYIGFSSTAQNSYFDVNTTGRSNDISYNVISTVTNVIGLNTAQLRDKANYAGWDFNSVWYQNGDMRPILRAEAAIAGGDGTIAISNLHQLALMGANVGGNYKLVADIDASPTTGGAASGIWSTSGWMPIGDASGMFTGTFDGQNHTIANLSINRPGTDSVGLFGKTYYSTIRNVGLVGGTVIGSVAVGALAGQPDRGSIQNVYAANVAVSGQSHIGGLVGLNYSSISGAYATGNVIGGQYAGGLVGTNFGSITNAYATGNVSGTTTGGLVGLNQGTIENAYATGTASGGGLVGLNLGVLTNSFWNTQTSGRGNACGSNMGPLCSATGLNTAQMKDPFTFIDAGWDFASIWATPKAGAAPVLRGMTAAPIYNYYARIAGDLSITYGDIAPANNVPLQGVGTNNLIVNWGSAINGSTNVGIYAWNGANVLSFSYAKGSASDYYIAYGSGGLTVTPRTITVVADAQSKIYGDANPNLTYTVTGLVNNDGLSGALSTSAGQFSGVGTYAINQGSLSASNNYTINYTGADLSVTPRTITVVADAQIKTYGDANPSLTYTATGLVNNDTLSGDLSTSAGHFSSVGAYAINQGSLAASSNYTIAYTGANLSVMPRTITIVADAQSKVYGNLDPSFTYTATGLVNNDVLIGSLSASTDQYSGVGVYAIGIGSLFASNNYTINYTGAALSITPRAISVTADAQSKIYGDTNPSLTYTATGLFGNDTLSGSLSTSAGQFSGVGTYAINQGTLANPNYAISYTSVDLSVTPKAITVAADAQSKVYGDVNPAFTYTATGLVNNDTLNGSLSTAAGQFSGVGAYAINQGTLANANYTINYTSADLSVTPKAITVAADAQSKVYGDVNPSLTYVATGLVNNDTLNGSLSTSAGQFSGVGVYAINRGSLENANYTISYTSADLSITPKAITVAADAQSKIYGDVNPSFTYTATGLVNSDTLNGSLSTVAGQFSGVGTYAINQGTLANANYTINYTSADLSVTPKAITVVADAQSKIYGDVNPAFTYTATGLVNNDTLNGSLSTAAGQFSGVGTYAINQGTLANANYTINYTSADLSVTPKAITVVADSQSKVYGDINPSFTYTATGLVNSDTLNGSLSTAAGQFSGVGSYAINQGTLANANYTINYTSADLSVTPKAITVVADAQSKIYGDVNPAFTYTATGLVNNDTLNGSLSTAAGQFSGVGRYAINQGSLANVNYTISYTSADLSVTPKAITVAADAQSKVYGDVNPNFSYVATGLVNNDTLSGSLSTSAGQFSGVGAYAINQGSLANANYAISYTSAALSITPKAITVAADAQSKIYGDVNPNLTYVATGLVNNDTLSGSLSTSVGQFSGVGAYAINQGTLANANYAISYTGADLSVTPRTITVVADAQSKIYGDVNPGLIYTATGLVNNDTLTGALSTGAGQFSNVGAYAINQGSLANANYTITYTSADLSVTPKAITVVADAQSKIYGDVNPAFTYTATGLVNNDTLNGSLSTAAGQFSGVGTYAINQGSLANANYTISYTSADLSVTPKAITVVADAQSKIYGDVNPAFTYTATGLVNNDILNGSPSTSAGQFSGVGNYAINQGSLANANYTISYSSADLSITPKTITVAADAQSKIYGDVNPSLTYTTTGLVNNDTLNGSLSTAVGQFSGVGTYAINQGTLVASNNYTINYTGADLSVTPKAITVVADGESKIYGDVNPALTYTATGLVNNDTLNGSLSTSAGQFSNVGAYAINQGTLANANYAISYTGADLLVTPKAITVAADAQSKIYGDANPSLTYMATGLVNSDTLNGALSTGAGQFSGVGTYAINQGTLANANYAISYTSADLLVTPKAITVAADARSKIYGDLNPSLTYTATGLVNGDTLTGSLSTAAGQYSNVGSYAINQGSISASSNYAISYTGADLAVNQRDISVSADSVSRRFGFANPALTYRVGGAELVNGDTLAGSLATLATSSSLPGPYAITQGTLMASSNYRMSFIPGILTVEMMLNIDSDSRASSVAATFDTGRVVPIQPASAAGDDADGRRILMTDPRFEGAMLCLDNPVGCSTLLSQARP
ncbi:MULTISPECIES: MBG domain-containing protein [unclassified Beijerinckia]|uniref:MBG domain-containing protein n=1 Tax=unclassified Beijerinckia TaxID=2638183 RepID=UPI00089B6CD0|nr:MULTISPECIES: MBG domain-containing protein [unclassified Beijerinckia]MDH7794012.1 filamentous hemagglutinin family protein [Beijerinckia sp. GAS462]SEB51354.1 filamentous hemagglutinin family N-terminal domain-containing protein [Beijerinckia sp. 28-YEA-48]